ncbi:MAG: hypothetical protein J6K51_04430 [Clostridia bacterium]|nr:hypothetical protein [Clostridia bacterium]MBP3448246.1 hypothetical protein [Clostridia bacterium]
MKRIFSFILAIAMVVLLLSSLLVKAEGIVFYNAETQKIITTLDGVNILYAKATATVPRTGMISVFVGHYEAESGKLTKMEPIVVTGGMTGDILTVPTGNITVGDTEMLKVFCWSDDDTIRPLLPGATITYAPVLTEKFETLFPNTDTYLYRIGNQNSVAVNKLFAPVADAEIGNVTLAWETVDETGATAVISEEADWQNRKITFQGTGLVKLSVTDDMESTKPTELFLEVVDAYNVTSASNATDRDIVLLNDCGMGQLVVSNGHTIYGNGFTMTISSDSAALDRGYAFMTLENGNLDNVQLKAPHFPYAILYEGNKKDDPTPNQIDGTKTRYYNIRSAVMTSGDCTIRNSYIEGGRAALYVTAGDLVLDNSTVYGGAAANIHLNAANSLTMKDVTLIQEPITATVHDTTKTLMGLSLITIADIEGNTTPITLEGKLIQYAWANEEYKQYVPAEGQSMVNYVLSQTDYIHPVTYQDGITRDSLNLGFIYMVEDGTNPVLSDPVIYDNRTNQDTVPYETLDMTSVKVYSYKNTNGTDPEVATYPTYESNANGNILATAVYSETDETKVITREYINETGWINRFTVNLDKGAYNFDFSKLTLEKYGKDLSYTVTRNGEAVDISQTIPVTVGTQMYELNVTDNVFYNHNGEAVTKTVTYTYPFYVSGTESNKNAPVLAATSWEAGLCVASSKGGTWHGAAPALEGVQITYWSVAESQYKTILLSDYTPTTLGKQNGTDTVWTYTPENEDFTLTVTGGQVHSSKKVYAMPVVVDVNGVNKLYFVASSSSGLVNSGNTARNVPVSYVFTDKNGKSLSFSHTWSVAEDKENEYNYTKFCEGTLEAAGDSSCFTADTFITLADGSKKAISEITSEDTILSYNFFTGEVEAKAVALLICHGEDTYPVANLIFSDGTALRIIGDHGVFDYDLNKYVYLTVDNMEEYVGHRFVKMDADGYSLVTLTATEKTFETTVAYSLTSAGNANALAEGLLTVAPPDEFYNWIEMGDTLRYDVDAFQKDMETYGLYTYDDFKGLVSYEQFINLNGAYLKIPVEKGIFTWDYIVSLIDLYVK